MIVITIAALADPSVLAAPNCQFSRMPTWTSGQSRPLSDSGNRNTSTFPSGFHPQFQEPIPRFTDYALSAGGGTRMKYLVLGAALVLALPLTSGLGVANAQDVRISVGDHDHDGWRHRHHGRGAYAYDRGCRVVVTQRINRFGDRVTVRKRVCY
jgi:hypothetical protein